MRARGVVKHLSYRLLLDHFSLDAGGRCSIYLERIHGRLRSQIGEQVVGCTRLSSLQFTHRIASHVARSPVPYADFPNSPARSLQGSLAGKSVAAWRRSLKVASATYPKNRIVQEVEKTSPEAEVENLVRKAAIPGLREYLRDVKGAPDEDAEFISSNCPVFVSELVESVTSCVVEQGSAEPVQSHIQRFLRSRDELSNKLVSHSREESLGHPTLTDIILRVKYPLALPTYGGFAKSMEVFNNFGWSRSTLCEAIERNRDLEKWTAEDVDSNIRILRRVGVAKKDILTMVEDASIFTLDLKDRLTPLLQYLDTIGIERHVLGDLMKFNPQGLIKMPLANFRERVEFLLDLGLSSAEVERSMRVFPQLVHLKLSNLSQKIEYFGGVGVDKKNMVKIVAKLPSIFRHSIDRNLVPKVQMLVSLGVVSDTLVKVIANYPELFGCSLENLQQKLAFFQANGLTGDRLVKMIAWHPRVFSFSIGGSLSKKLQFFLNKGFVLRSIPMVRALSSCITISTDSLEHRFLNLMSIGFSREEVCLFLQKQPTILCLSERNIRMKVDYLVNTMNRSTEEIIVCPGYLLYSLEMRIKPRHRVLSFLTVKGLLRPDPYTLSTILQRSENEFIQKFVSLHPDCHGLYLDGMPVMNPEQTSKVDKLSAFGLVAESVGNGESAPKVTASMSNLVIT